MKIAAEKTQDEKNITAERYQADEYAKVYKSQYQAGYSLKNLRSRLIARFEIKTIQTIIDHMNIQGKILDVPCGTGKLGSVLSQYPVQITAGDISESMMKYARGEYAEDKLDGFAVCDVCDLQFSDSAFDSIVCLRLFQRLPKESRLECLKEFARVTKDDLVISYSRSTPWQRLKNALRWVYDRSNPTFFHLTRQEILDELISAGFEVKNFQHVLPVISSEVIIHCRLQQ